MHGVWRYDANWNQILSSFSSDRNNVLAIICVHVWIDGCAKLYRGWIAWRSQESTAINCKTWNEIVTTTTLKFFFLVGRELCERLRIQNKLNHRLSMQFWVRVFVGYLLNYFAYDFVVFVNVCIGYSGYSILKAFALFLDKHAFC